MNIRKILALSSVTSKEFTQREVIIAIVSVWISIMFVTLAFATVSIGERILVLSDFGLFLNNIIPVLLIILGGSNLLSKEIKRKSIYTVLSKPISRTEYLLGKFLGLMVASTIFNITLHILLVGLIWAVEAHFLPILFVNIWYVWLETSILSAICLLASSVMVTPALVGITTAAIFITGRNIGVLVDILQNRASEPFLYQFIRIIESILPSLSSINVANSLTYQHAPKVEYAINSLLYGTSYTAMILALTILVFRRREFN